MRMVLKPLGHLKVAQSFGRRGMKKGEKYHKAERERERGWESEGGGGGEREDSSDYTR